jgi:hypothetical protein
MNMQTKIRLVAEVGPVHPVKSQLLKWADEPEGSGGGPRGQLAVTARGMIPAANDDREVDLRNVAVLGYN